MTFLQRVFRRRRAAEPLPPVPGAIEIIAGIHHQLGEVELLLGDLKTVLSHERGHADAREDR